MKTQLSTQIAVLMPLLWGGPSLFGVELAQFLAEITSPDKEVRYSARMQAGELGAQAVAPLGNLLGDQRREVALTAQKALENVAHKAGAPQTPPEEARAVAAELSKLLKKNATLKVKLDVLQLLSFIGTDENVSTISALLQDEDKHVREAARLALEAILGDSTTGNSATAALIEGARRAPPERTGDFLFSLGRKKSEAAKIFLLANTSHESDVVRFSALQSLAYMTAPEAIDRFKAEIRERESPTRRAVFTEYLRLADNLLDSGEPVLARQIYEQALREAPIDYQRERALYQLSSDDSPESLAAMLVALSDPAARVRSLAIRRISNLKGEEVTKVLRAAYQGSTGEKRSFLLRAIAERDGANAQLLIKAATGSIDPELKITALDLQGQLLRPGLESTFIELARNGSPSVRPTAVKGYLLLADERLAAAARAKREAGEMYARALDVATSDSQRAAAIQGIKSVGDPNAIDTLAPLLGHSVVGGDASEVFVTLGEILVDRGEVDRAEPLLLKILDGQFPETLKIRAADSLKNAGRDPQANVLNQGFVLDWWMIGPISAEDDTALTTKFFPEESRVFDKVHNIGPRRYVWQRPRLLTTTGGIDLLPRFRRSLQRVAYAYTELASRQEQDVLFKIGSNDGVVCFLNDEPIHLSDRPRSLIIDEDVVKTRLKAGKNLILLKVHNLGGNWGFSFRITDLKGAPLVLKSVLDD